MKIRVLGGGWYGCHIAAELIKAGHAVELHEIAGHLFAGASGANPARLHLGFHYPRSRLTRAMCQESHARFMREYGHLTRTIPTNVYAVAADDSLVDFGTYRQVLKGEVEFVELERPEELGLRNVEGAVLTGERHIVIRLARAFYEEKLAGAVRYGMPPQAIDEREFDWTIDCTFCARDGQRIDRYEPCVTGILKSAHHWDRAVTIMDGPFPSVYPWDEDAGLSSLTSARFTPLERCATHEEAARVLATVTPRDLRKRVHEMWIQLCHYWPGAGVAYDLADMRVGIRAMPLSGAAARLVDVIETGPRTLRIRAGKIDAIFHAADQILETICRA